jgi:uncharacterized alpha/beta hydrolase family protein
MVVVVVIMIVVMLLIGLLKLFVPSMFNIVHYSFFVFLYWTLFHYMFRPNYAIFRCTGVVVKDSAAHCNAVSFPPTVVASGYIGYVGHEERLVNDVAHRRHRSFKSQIYTVQKDAEI